MMLDGDTAGLFMSLRAVAPQKNTLYRWGVDIQPKV